MSRSRFPAPYAIFQLVMRLISVALCLATFMAAVYTSVRYGYGRGMIGAFIAAIWTITVDAPEIAGLIDAKRHVRRCTEGYLAFLSFVTMFICGILPIAVLLDFEGVSHECGSRPAEKCEAERRRRSEASNSAFVAWVLPCTVAGLHLIFFILACIDRCRRNRSMREAQ